MVSNVIVIMFILGKPCPALSILDSNTTSMGGVFEVKLHVKCSLGYVVENTCTWNGIQTFCDDGYDTICQHNQTWDRTTMCKRMQN